MDAVKVLIAFYSRTGSTEALAKAVAEGARAEGAKFACDVLRDFVDEKIIQSVPGWAANRDRMYAEYEAQPKQTRNGPMQSSWNADAIWQCFGRVEGLYRSLGGLWFQGKLNGRREVRLLLIDATRWKETTITSLYTPMAHLGFILVPLGYADPAMFRAGTPYGASSVSGQNNTPPTADIWKSPVFRENGSRMWPKH